MCSPVAVGDVFGNWKALERIKGSKRRHPHWRCVCTCGTTKDIDQDNLVYGRTKSCGCLPKGDWCVTHGLSRDPIIGAWRNVISRCCKPNHASYSDYGGRGIKVCDRWLDFQAFYEDVGPHPGNGLTLDRINNEGHYEPGNVRWSDRATQARNTRANVFVEHLGRTLCIQDWGTELRVTANHLYRRHRKGMTWHQAIDDILANPPRNRGPYRFSKTKPTKEIT